MLDFFSVGTLAVVGGTVLVGDEIVDDLSLVVGGLECHYHAQGIGLDELGLVESGIHVVLDSGFCQIKMVEIELILAHELDAHVVLREGCALDGDVVPLSGNQSVELDGIVIGIVAEDFALGGAERIQGHMGGVVVGVGSHGILGAAVHAGTFHMHGLVCVTFNERHFLDAAIQRIGCAAANTPARVVVLQALAVGGTVDGNHVQLQVGGLIGVGRGCGHSLGSHVHGHFIRGDIACRDRDDSGAGGQCGEDAVGDGAHSGIGAAPGEGARFDVAAHLVLGRDGEVHIVAHHSVGALGSDAERGHLEFFFEVIDLKLPETVAITGAAGDAVELHIAVCHSVETEHLLIGEPCKHLVGDFGHDLAIGEPSVGVDIVTGKDLERFAVGAFPKDDHAVERLRLTQVDLPVLRIHSVPRFPTAVVASVVAHLGCAAGGNGGLVQGQVGLSPSSQCRDCGKCKNEEFFHNGWC